MFTKYYKQILSTVTALLAASSLSAGVALITFDANTTAKASEVNTNFITLETRITNNTSNISSLNTDKQNRVSSSCAVGSSIRSINVDGTVTCEIDDNTISSADITSVTATGGLTGGGTSGDVTISSASGAVSINHYSMTSNYGFNNLCNLNKNNTTYVYHDTSSTNAFCVAVGGLQFPDGVTVTSATCGVYSNDADATNFPIIYLRRTGISGVGSSTMARMDVGSNSTTVQTLTDNTIDDAVVDNSAYTYGINFYAFHADDAGIDNRFYGCKFNYIYE